MSLSELEEARHARERGAILEALKQGYELEMVSLASLAATLNMVGQPMTRQALQFSLSILADSGYVKIWRARDTPAWRPDRANEVRPDAIVFAKLLPKGLMLIDARIDADPLVAF
jgi:hypothetical protein